MGPWFSWRVKGTPVFPVGETGRIYKTLRFLYRDSAGAGLARACVVVAPEPPSAPAAAAAVSSSSTPPLFGGVSRAI